MAVTIFAVQAWADTDAANEKIVERIKPVGTVCAGSECAGPTAAASSGARSGEAVYNSACVACHGSGLLDAPKKGDTEIGRASCRERYLNPVVRYMISLD